MKKKVLSTLLAVCLFVGMAIPAVFAAAPLSALSGNADEVTSIKFAKTSYSIAKDEDKDFADQVTAFATNKKMVQEPNLSWELDSPDGKFSISGSKVYALDTGATATLRAVSEDGKVKGEVKLTSTAAVPAKKDATSFKFKDKTIYLVSKVIAGTYNGVTVTDVSSPKVEFVIVPGSTSTAFTSTQVTNIGTAVTTALDKLISDALAAAGVTGITVSTTAATAVDKDGQIIVTVPEKAFDGVTATEFGKFIDQLKTTANLSVANVAMGNNTASAKVSVKAKNGAVATNIGGPSNVTIKVGETYDISKKINTSPSTATGTGTKTYSTDYYGNDAESEYAVVDADGVITGISVGKNIVETQIVVPGTAAPSATIRTVRTVVTVEPATSVTTEADKGAAKISATTASIKVGTQVTLSVKDAAKDAKITWKVDNKNVSIDPYTGSATVVRGKVAGTSKVTALVDGVEVGTCTITVAAAGTTVTPPTTPVTPNPSTGDSLFANLF